MELIKMTCRNCGEKLEVAKDAEQILCQHCGSEYLIMTHEGAISIKSAMPRMQTDHASSQKVSAELALVRLRNEIDDLWIKAYDMYKIIGLYHYDQRKLPDIDQKRPFTANPKIVLIHLEKVIEIESRKIFGNRAQIRKFEQAYQDCQLLVDRLDKIEQEERKYLQIVN